MMESEKVDIQKKTGDDVIAKMTKRVGDLQASTEQMRIKYDKKFGAKKRRIKKQANRLIEKAKDMEKFYSVETDKQLDVAHEQSAQISAIDEDIIKQGKAVNAFYEKEHIQHEDRNEAALDEVAKLFKDMAKIGRDTTGAGNAATHIFKLAKSRIQKA